MVQEEISFTDLIASSIHDMKNSLNLQVSALERIAMQCREKGDMALVADLGSVIYQASRMNLNLVEMLSLYKIAKSTYPLDINHYAVADVVDEAVLQNRAMLDFKHIRVQVDCDPGCHWYMDRDLIKGVLVNALNNAYHYTQGEIRIAAAVVNRQLELRVEDNGPGYPQHMLSQPLAGSDRGVNFETGSTGLGLYFSEQVARLHKNGSQRGTLAIENGGAWGGGCFVLRLP